jgi:putative glutamine amidotransferase
MNRERAPLIGITMRYDAESERFYLARAYSEAVQAAGGVPVHIPLIPDGVYLGELVERLDGMLLPGSASDVDPILYGHEPHGKLGSVHPLRDKTDRMILEIIERRSTPLLAICYGLQALNVWRGGALIQDITSEDPAAIKHEQGAPRDRRSHKIRLAAQSRLREYAGASEAFVNSHHHQALRTIGENLRAVAWTSDGLIEAVEESRGDRWVVGVQWHPEIAWAEDDFSRTLFARFIYAASRFAAQTRERQQETVNVR